MAVLDETRNTPQAWNERSTSEHPWDAAGWTRESQQARFRAVSGYVDVKPGERLLDFGCGPGGYSLHVPAGVSYVGYDWAAGMVDRAQRDHPQGWFTSDWPSGGFDAVVCIGPFNLPDGWTKQETWHTLRHLWDTTGCRILAVSLYAGEDDRCLIYDTDEIHDHLLGESYYAQVERWRHNDLLAVIRR